MNLNVTITLNQQGVERVVLAMAKRFSVQFLGRGDRLPSERWIECYLKGQKAPLPPLDLQQFPTPFCRDVCLRLEAIPFGESLTYGELVTKDRARAVGGALSKNPFALFLPCHRVVASKGIGGFAFGQEVKQELLNYEMMS